jgi:hypothetical protein
MLSWKGFGSWDDDNWKGFGRKLPWLNGGSILASVRGERDPEDSRCFSGNSNPVPTDTRTLSFGRRSIMCRKPNVALKDAGGMKRAVPLWH